MSIQEMLLTSGGVVGILLVVIQFSPIKIDPFGLLMKGTKKALRAFGKAINAEVLDELSEVRATQRDTAEKLDEQAQKLDDQTEKLNKQAAKLDDQTQKLDDHIRIDGEINADLHRTRILQFNNELLRDIHHTREDFIEILAEIDKYERYCKEHPEYENNRAVHAIANIGRVYDRCMEKHDFLSC